MNVLTILAVLAALVGSSSCLRDERTVNSGGRIVGGEAIRIEEAPYQASLMQFSSHICGAAIISTTFVITAAHCTFGRTADTLTVRVGATTNYEGGDVHSVAKVVSHPKYNVVTFDFDVALLQLEKSIAINNITKQEISLPFQGEALPENTPVLVSGWGETRNVDEPSSILRAVTLKISNQRQCHLKYLSDGGVTKRMVCAFALNKDSCAGDSGGPVRRLSDGKLVGLVSFGPGNLCADPNYPGVYTRVASIRKWIKVNMKINSIVKRKLKQ